MAVACGLDFGTSNTTLGLAAGERGAQLVRLEGEATTLPSAIFFDLEEHRPLFGQAAVDAYVGGSEGRLLRALKSVLGTSLMDEETQVGSRRLRLRAILARFLGEVKRRAELAADGQGELTAVVHGRPVHFVDGDPAADAKAERVLAEIARGLGFAEVSFQLEPIAAALEYEASAVHGEEVALVADIGGGTSDFSVVRLAPDRQHRADRRGDVLASFGVRVGGTDFDRELALAAVMPSLGLGSPMRRAELVAPVHLFADLATWSRVNLLYTPRVVAMVRELVRESAAPERLALLLAVLERRRGHSIVMAAERAKIILTEQPATTIDLGWLEPGLAVSATAGLLEAATARSVARIGGAIGACLRMAGLRSSGIDAVFLTGGSTLLPAVRRAITAQVPQARIVTGDQFGSVGMGLAIEAARRYGC